jgi:hypothetical protein
MMSLTRRGGGARGVLAPPAVHPAACVLNVYWVGDLHPSSRLL